MRRFNNVWGWLRLAVVVIMAGVVTTGVTYAALQSQQAVLNSNTIESAIATLSVSKDGATYLGAVAGFDFAGIIPGGAAMPSSFGGYPLWLKNTGSAPLNLNITVATAPTTTGSVDLSKVYVVLTPVVGGGTAQSISIAALLASNASGGIALTTPTLAINTAMQYKIQVQMAADAFVGSSATISGLDLAFGGTASTQ